MKLSDVTIEVRSAALGRLGQIRMDYVTDFQAVKRYCNVGSWQMSLPAEYPLAQELAKSGRGITVTGPAAKTLFSGPMISAEKEITTEDLSGYYSFIGSDDMIHLADGEAWPTPLAVATAQGDYDVRSGIAETIARQYVGYNRIPGIATSDRAVAGLALRPDLARGATVIANARYDSLGSLLSDIGQAGGVGFDMVQSGTSIYLEVYVPTDKSKTIRMTVANDLLKESKTGIKAPTETRVIAAGQGDLAARNVKQYTTTASLLAETQWARKIEFFKDRRDTNDDSQISQDALADLALNGQTITSLTVQPADQNTMVMGKDWYLGDIISVSVDGQDLHSIVKELIISINQSGVNTAATIGDPTGFDFESQLISAQQDQAARIAFLEQNAEFDKSSATYILGTIYPWSETTVPSWALELNGQAVSRTAYSGLFALYGTSYGVGDGSTTFNLPDWTGRVPVGFKTGDTNFGTMKAKVGEAAHTLTVPEIPPHAHQPGPGGAGSSAAGNTGDIPGRSNVATADPNFRTGSALYTSTTYGSTVSSSGGPHNNVQPSVVVKWIVCAATSSGAFDTAVQTALVNRVGVLETQGPRPIIPSSVSVVGAGSSYTINADGTISVVGATSVVFNGILKNNGHRFKLYGTDIFATAGTSGGGYLYAGLAAAGVSVGGAFWSGGCTYRQGATAAGDFAHSDVANTPQIGYVSATTAAYSDFDIEFLKSYTAHPRIKVCESSYGGTSHTNVWGAYERTDTAVLSADGVIIYSDKAMTGTFEFWELMR